MNQVDPSDSLSAAAEPKASKLLFWTALDVDWFDDFLL